MTNDHIAVVYLLAGSTTAQWTWHYSARPVGWSSGWGVSSCHDKRCSWHSQWEPTWSPPPQCDNEQDISPPHSPFLYGDSHSHAPVTEILQVIDLHMLWMSCFIVNSLNLSVCVAYLYTNAFLIVSICLCCILNFVLRQCYIPRIFFLMTFSSLTNSSKPVLMQSVSFIVLSV